MDTITEWATSHEAAFVAGATGVGTFVADVVPVLADSVGPFVAMVAGVALVLSRVFNGARAGLAKNKPA